MFNKILIANRGEIAVRIIRACRNMGIRSVAVYSKEDAKSMHVQLADQRICIGEGPARNSYLNMDRIISAARNMGADAIHPGFGFLSENSEFVRKCQENGITFIGPEADVIDKMGNKSQARKTMMEAGVPVVPGTKEPVFDAEEALKIARSNSIENQVNVEFIKSDLFSEIPNEKFDMIISNPPYIETELIKSLSAEVKKEPVLALDGGEDGLKFYRRIAKEAKEYLKDNGYLALEIGYNQKKFVEEILKNNNFKNIYCKKDFAGNNRIIIARK